MNTSFKYGVILIIKHTIIHFIIELKLFNNAAVAKTTAIRTSAIILGIFVYQIYQELDLESLQERP